MDDRSDLLIELGTEELPPTALRRLRDDFSALIVGGLRDAGLEPGTTKSFATPRRLAVAIQGLRIQQPEQVVERRGPAVAAAFDQDGQPTRAAIGFASSCGAEVSDLERVETEKGAWLYYRGHKAGRPASELIAALLPEVIHKLPVPKRMRWGDHEHSFVRPVHWLVVLLGDEVVDASVLGVASSRTSRGHRFHGPASLEIASAASYEKQLHENAHVIADLDARRQEVLRQVEAAARTAGGVAMIDEALLEEVTALVEWPAAIIGTFEKRFLDIPPEVLVSSMQGHQRYFPVRGSDDQLLPSFVTIANLESRNPDEVARGNQRVIRPRLADAEFFWQQDRREPLSQRIEKLKEIIFQKRLGSLYDKAVRVAALSRQLAPEFGVDPTTAERAALLGKCDLLTEMVGEFPELQGIMGRYYAAHEGLGDGIPEALEQHYQPRFAGDQIPTSPLGQVLAVAERADTLIGIFAIGQAPSGDKDPFALRRAGLGLMRILVESQRQIPLLALFGRAADHLPEDVKGDAVVDAVFEFCMDRLKAYYLDQGLLPELFEAVRDVRVNDGEPVDEPVDFDRRIHACSAFLQLDAARSLAAANKRVNNILRKADGVDIPEVPSADLLQVEAEKTLYAVIEPLTKKVTNLARQGDYQQALEQLATARDGVDAFFDQVMVMDEDMEVRGNRLALLRQLSQLFTSVADISRLPSQ